MGPRLRSVLVASSVILVAILSVWLLWPTSYVPPSASQLAPGERTLAEAGPDVEADELASVKQQLDSALQLGPSPERDTQLADLDTKLRDLELRAIPTSLMAVQVLELRQRIRLAQGKRAEAVRDLHAWLAERGIQGRHSWSTAPSDQSKIENPKSTMPPPAWGTAGNEILDRIYRSQLAALRSDQETINKEPFSQSKFDRLEQVENSIRSLGRTMATDSKTAQTYESLLQKSMLAQAKYGELGDEFARWMDEVKAAEGDERAAMKAVWEAEWLMERNLPDEAQRLFALVAQRYPATERGSYAALMAAKVDVRQQRPTPAKSRLEANIAAYDEGRWAAESYMILGDLLYHEGRHTDAIATYRLLALRHPDFPLSAYLLLWAARIATGQGNYPLATELVNEMRTQFPNSQHRPESKRALEWLRDHTGVDVLGQMEPGDKQAVPNTAEQTSREDES